MIGAVSVLDGFRFRERDIDAEDEKAGVLRRWDVDGLEGHTPRRTVTLRTERRDDHGRRGSALLWSCTCRREPECAHVAGARRLIEPKGPPSTPNAHRMVA